MRKFLFTALALSVIISLAPAVAAAGVSAEEAFDQLKGLAGTWEGEAEGAGAEAESEAEKTTSMVHEIQVSAAGTVVMETMAPGTDHEMINMYHLDGEDLVLTHYCAGGNQPQMRLDRAASSPDQLVFEFAGGTNLDPAVDNHIHAARIQFLGDNRMDSVWKAHAGGEEVATMTFHLARQN
jgi:hypothetical protein